MFIETSAKAGFNIKALFRKLATALPGMETANPVQQPAQNCKCVSRVVEWNIQHIFAMQAHVAHPFGSDLLCPCYLLCPFFALRSQ